MKRKNNLKDVIKLIESSEHSKAKNLLKQILKKQVIKGNAVFELSTIYQSLGDRERAIKVLGKLRAKNELDICTEFDLKKQVVIAYRLSALGCDNLAKRIFDNLQTCFAERNINPLQVHPMFYYYLSVYYLNKGFYKVALDYTIKPSEINPPKDNKTFLKFISYAQGWALYELGDYKRSLIAFKKLLSYCHNNDMLWKGIAYCRQGEVLWRQHKYKTAKDYLNLALDNIGKDSVGEMCYLMRCFGALEHENKNPSKAIKYFLQGLEAIKDLNTSPRYHISIFYYLDKMNFKLNLGQKVALCCHPSFQPYSYLAGKKFISNNGDELPLWAQNIYKETTDNCWIISNVAISQANYFTLSDADTDKKVLIDLVSGVLKQKNADNIKVLSSIQVRALHGIISSGVLGINKLALADFVYEQNFQQPEDGEKRLEQIILGLKKLKLNITLKNSMYYFSFKKSELVFIPMNESMVHPINYIKKTKTEIGRKDVEETYNTNSSNAKRWIKKWLLEEKLKVSKGPNKWIIN